MRGHRSTARWASLPDFVLVSQFRAGAPEAFSTLVERHGAALHRYVIGWLHHASLAEDLTQAAFVKAATRIDQLKDGQAFLSWLMTIARTTAMDHLRSQRPERQVPLEEQAERATPNLKHDIRIDVRRILALLAPDEREVLLLSDYLQLSMQELATTLAIGVSAAKMRLQRARTRFRHLYSPEA